MEDNKPINKKKGPQLYPAPIVRFALELLTWIILIVVGYWYITVILVLLLSQLNFPGDKRPAETLKPGIMVPGFVRIGVEMISAVVGIWGAFQESQIWGFIAVGLGILYIIFDFHRFRWMLGMTDKVPESVLGIYS